MSTLTRKQREIKARESLIIDTASDMLLKEGYLNMSMDRIAERIEYSKGTVYQHFRSKEDVILAIQTRAMQTRISLFKHANDYPGNSRQRFTAVGLADRLMIEHFPALFIAEQLCKTEAFDKKYDSQRIVIKDGYETGCNQVLYRLIQDAVQSGDLKPVPGINPMEVVFACWTMSIGAHTLAHVHASDLDSMGLQAPYTILENNYDRICDSFDWKPLASEYDYHHFRRELKAEYFNECFE